MKVKNFFSLLIYLMMLTPTFSLAIELKGRIYPLDEKFHELAPGDSIEVRVEIWPITQDLTWQKKLEKQKIGSEFFLTDLSDWTPSSEAREVWTTQAVLVALKPFEANPTRVWYQEEGSINFQFQRLGDLKILVEPAKDYVFLDQFLWGMSLWKLCILLIFIIVMVISLVLLRKRKGKKKDTPVDLYLVWKNGLSTKISREALEKIGNTGRRIPALDKDPIFQDFLVKLDRIQFKPHWSPEEEKNIVEVYQKLTMAHQGKKI